MQNINESNATLLFKFILIGDVAVGKTSLLQQFVEKKFQIDYNSTVGVEFNTKVIQIEEDILKLQIWDTSGQEEFKSVTRLYYRAAAGAVMVYDITKRDTFENIKNWHREALDNGNPKMHFLLIGNKTDLEENREVQNSEASTYANENECLFIETSAKDGYNVENAFMQLAHYIYQMIQEDPDQIDQNHGVKVLKDSKNSNIRSSESNNKKEQSLVDCSQNDYNEYHNELNVNTQKKAKCNNCCQEL